MSKKIKTEVIKVLSSEEAFDVQKPRYNGWQTGHGKHKNKKAYDRKDKSWEEEEY